MQYRNPEDKRKDLRFVLICKILFFGLISGIVGALCFAFVDSMWLHFDLYGSILYTIVAGGISATFTIASIVRNRYKEPFY